MLFKIVETEEIQEVVSSRGLSMELLLFSKLMLNLRFERRQWIRVCVCHFIGKICQIYYQFAIN